MSWISSFSVARRQSDSLHLLVVAFRPLVPASRPLGGAHHASPCVALFRRYPPLPGGDCICSSLAESSHLWKLLYLWKVFFASPVKTDRHKYKKPANDFPLLLQSQDLNECLKDREGGDLWLIFGSWRRVCFGSIIVLRLHRWRHCDNYCTSR